MLFDDAISLGAIVERKMINWNKVTPNWNYPVLFDFEFWDRVQKQFYGIPQEKARESQREPERAREILSDSLTLSDSL